MPHDRGKRGAGRPARVIPKKPVPDLIRDEDRFSEKVMREAKFMV